MVTLLPLRAWCPSDHCEPNEKPEWCFRVIPQSRHRQSLIFLKPAQPGGLVFSVSKFLTEELRSCAENGGGGGKRNFLAPSALASRGKTARAAAKTLCRLLCIAATTASATSSSYIFLILLTVANPVHFRVLAYRQLKYLFEQYLLHDRSRI